MKLDVKLFAQARDLAGSERVEVELSDAACVADLRSALTQRVPQLKQLAPSLLIALGTEYADDSMRIEPSAEVACFPPVSGG